MPVYQSEAELLVAGVMKPYDALMHCQVARYKLNRYWHARLTTTRLADSVPPGRWYPELHLVANGGISNDSQMARTGRESDNFHLSGNEKSRRLDLDWFPEHHRVEERHYCPLE